NLLPRRPGRRGKAVDRQPGPQAGIRAGLGSYRSEFGHQVAPADGAREIPGRHLLSSWRVCCSPASPAGHDRARVPAVPVTPARPTETIMVLLGSCSGGDGQTMTAAQVFTSRLRGRPLLDSDGLTIGRIRDVVLLPAAGTEPPRALGLVVTLQRRRIFVNLGAITEISVDGAHLRGGTVDLDRFTRRTGEILASELYGKQTQDGTVVDVAIIPREQRRVGWEVSTLAVVHGRGLRHRRTTIVPWDKYPELFRAGPMADQLVGLRELQPADLAQAVEGMSPSRRNQLAAALDDEELADLLDSLELERSADVVEEMEPDDAADLLAEMPPEQRERLLTAMEAVPAAELRRLLLYDATTAGGLMTPQPLIVTPDVSVAEVLARVRDPETPVTAAVQVYVCE